MDENVLSVLEKSLLAKGLASERTRLKAGRIIWDEIEAGLPQAVGEAEQDVNRLDAFKKIVEARPSYEKRALKRQLITRGIIQTAHGNRPLPQGTAQASA